MPDPDIDPPAGPFGGKAGIKTPWESIDPDEAAQAAPEPPQTNPAKKPRRRAKAAVGTHYDDQPVPSLPAVAKAAETDGVTDDADDEFTVMAFLPDEHFAQTETASTATDHGNEQTEPVREDDDEPMVEIFLDRSEGDSRIVAESEKQFTTSSAIIDEDQTGVTESLEDALAEKAFFPDEVVAPLEMNVPASNVKSESSESTRDVDTPPVKFFAQVSPEDPTSGNVVEVELVRQPSTIMYPSDVFGAVVAPPVVERQAAIIPVIFAAADDVEPTLAPVESSPPGGERPGSTRDSNKDSALTLTANSAAGALAGGLIAPSPPSADGVGVTTEFQNTTIVVGAIQPPETLTSKVVSASSAHPFAPVEIADHVEPKTVRSRAASIRYLRPKSGSPIRMPAAVIPVEIADEAELDPEPEFPETSVTSGGGWTIPLMCLGIGLIACCVIIPQADSNRRLYYQRQELASDLESIQKQVAVNDEFLKEVIDNPTLAERLASRQMKTIRKGQKVLAVRQVNDDGDMSPFALVAVPRPPTPMPYKPVIGTIANLCNDARSRLYLLGVSMTMVAVGLVLGFNPKREE